MYIGFIGLRTKGLRMLVPRSSRDAHRHAKGLLAAGVVELPIKSKSNPNQTKPFAWGIGRS